MRVSRWFGRLSGAAVAALLVCAFGHPTFAQQTVHVDATNCPGPGNGSAGNPYCKIQDGICFLKNNGGGVVSVRPGTYFEAIRMFAGISVISTDGPTVTIIDATGRPCVSQDCTLNLSSTTCSAVQMREVNGVGLTTADRLEGFRITGGRGTLRVFGDGTPFVAGGGILVTGSSPTITNNQILSNFMGNAIPTLSFYGAGIYIQSSTPLVLSQPVITNNVIDGNVADPPEGTLENLSYAVGGGIYAGYNSAPQIIENTIRSNFAGFPGRVFQRATGGGIAVYSIVGTAVISQNLILSNLGADRGGGVSLGHVVDALSGTVTPSHALVESNIFEYNSSALGGGILARTTTGKIRSNTFADNSGTTAGGAILIDTPLNPAYQATLVNNVITLNDSTYYGFPDGTGGGLAVYTTAEPIVHHNDFFANVPNNVGGVKIDADYIGVNSNLGVDPQFTAVPPAVFDEHLLAGSGLIDKGDNSEAPSSDFDGAPRIQDGDLDDVAVIDPGVYEFADLDLDGIQDWIDPDDDGDGADDVTDCSPRIASVSAPAGMVGPTLRIAKSAGQGVMTWARAPQGHVSNVYRGSRAAGAAWAYNEVCFDPGLPGLQSTDSGNPALGAFFFYLISAKNICGESAAGQDSEGVYIFPSVPCSVASLDTDSDGIPDLRDNCALTSNAQQVDTDHDFRGDDCDICTLDPDDDADHDTLCANVDNCPTVANLNQLDLDTDGDGDACDNCVSVPNPDQLNSDNDALGNACDTDDDNDGLLDGADNCPTVANASQTDTDLDTVGNACDNCPSLSNTAQSDGDTDQVGDVCDNCPFVANQDQANADGNALGSACELAPVGLYFLIGSTEVTNTQYARFLNSVAALSDPNGVFNPSMQDDLMGGITRLGPEGGFSYVPKPNMGDKPVNFVSWLDAARYANWMSRGRPVGVQSVFTTEDGAYNLTVANPGSNASRQVDAFFYLPNDAEWVQAAYHDESLPGDWLYPTRSNSAPTLASSGATGTISNPGANVANYNLGADWNGLDGNVTAVGSAGWTSTSAYHTYDQGGNVHEWTETALFSNRVIRGGNFADPAARLASTSLISQADFVEDAETGFRIARRAPCPDTDNDGLTDCTDNCPLVTNPSQADADGDEIGDACDACDNLADYLQIDSDADGRGDSCDACPFDPFDDQDDDGLCGNVDNCPTVANVNQADDDTDGAGNACDNCPGLQNPDQADRDADTFGDLCDNCPSVPNASQADTDANGIGNACPFVPVDGQYYLETAEVTNAEYAAFLNAIGASDPNGLYNASMGSNPRGGITQSGVSGSFTYTLKPNMAAKPVNFVSWLDGARYANWLHHGKPTGAQGPGTTQDGAYNLGVSNPGVNAVREPGAVYFLPDDTEWTTAAYHDPSIGGDWTYPTRSNSIPTMATASASGVITNPGPNVANYGNGADWAGQDGNVTSVGGAGSESATYYGTYDQGGNVSEWVETASLGRRVVRGGGFSDAATFLQVDGGETRDYFIESNKTGFRVARRITCTDANFDGTPELVAEVGDLRLSKAPATTLVWAADANAAGYDVATGAMSSFAASGTSAATCLATNLIGTSTADTQLDPTLGAGYYYLVRAKNGCGGGNWGHSSAGVPRALSSTCP